MAIVFLILSNIQTERELALQSQDLGIANREIAVVESSLVLTNIQTKLLIEANELDRQRELLMESEARETVKQYINDQKPIIDLSTAKCYLKDGYLAVSFDMKNAGKSSASDVTMETYFKAVFSGIDKTPDIDRLGVIPPEKTIVSSKNIGKPNDYYAKVHVKWKWDYIQSEYENIFFRIIHMNADSSCSCYMQSSDEAASHWSK